jgi:FkbM family methyltransferase
MGSLLARLSSLSNHSASGRLLRLPLRALPRTAIVPILSGTGRGFRWQVGSGVHRYWIGTYERDNQEVLKQVLKPGMVVYDVGANAGFYSLIASRLVGPSGCVFAFEPLPSNLEFIRLHIRINRISNVSVIPAAVAGGDGEAMFILSEHAEMGRLAGSTDATSSMGKLLVKTVSLDGFATQYKAPDVIKMDIEGAEVEALRAASSLFRNKPPCSLLISTHSAQLHRDCLELLESFEYTVHPVGNDNLWACR